MISTQGLTKVFKDKKKGTVVAVDHLDLDVREGEIYGLLGTNGAGKTTTLRMLATVFQPTEGAARVAGFDTVKQPDEVRRAIGFLSGDTNLYARLTGREVMAYYGGLYGMKGQELKDRVEELNAALHMEKFIDKKYGKMSTGQKKRVSIARSIVHNPKLMIFDEPTSGLDPIAAKHIVDFIRSCGGEKRTVLFSTHYLREAETLCDRIGVLHEGTLKAVGTLEEILAETGKDDLEQAFYYLAGIEDMDMSELV